MDTRMCAHTHTRNIHPVSHMQCTVNILLLTKRSLNTLTKILYLCLFFASCTTNWSCVIKHMQESQILHHFMISCICIIKQSINITWANNIIKTSYKSVQAPFTTEKQIIVKTYFGVCGWGEEGGNHYDAKAKDKCLQNWHMKHRNEAEEEKDTPTAHKKSRSCCPAARSKVITVLIRLSTWISTITQYTNCTFVVFKHFFV